VLDRFNKDSGMLPLTGPRNRTPLKCGFRASWHHSAAFDIGRSC
jgi:hypothetical protein